MSQTYWVEVIEAEVETKLSQSLIEIELRLSLVGVKISQHWIKEEIGLSWEWGDGSKYVLDLLM